MFRQLSISAASILVAATIYSSAHAQNSDKVALTEPVLVGEFRDWVTFRAAENGNPFCFSVSRPVKSHPQGVNRDPVHFFITSRPADNVLDEINIEIGYPHKKGKKGLLTVGKQTFKLTSLESNAWIDDNVDGAAVIQAIKRGRQMVVKGESWRGTKTTDTFSLLGVTAALNSARKACGL